MDVDTLDTVKILSLQTFLLGILAGVIIETALYIQSTQGFGISFTPAFTNMLIIYGLFLLATIYVLLPVMIGVYMIYRYRRWWKQWLGMTVISVFVVLSSLSILLLHGEMTGFGSVLVGIVPAAFLFGTLIVFRDRRWHTGAVLIGLNVILAGAFVAGFAPSYLVADAGNVGERITYNPPDRNPGDVRLACYQLAERIQSEYCSQYVNPSATEPCTTAQNERTLNHTSTASQQGCNWLEHSGIDPTVSIHGRVYNCIDDGYLQPACPAG